uniref:Uncharacterized protein n=1 Tax=Anguilla anguilla TaxID=7936 RepID=A0A0E9WEK1_ANGAN
MTDIITTCVNDRYNHLTEFYLFTCTKRYIFELKYKIMEHII